VGRERARQKRLNLTHHQDGRGEGLAPPEPQTLGSVGDNARSVTRSRQTGPMLNVPARWRTGTMTARSAFAAPPFDRPLRIIVDDQSVASDAALDLIASLAKRPGVCVFRTAQESPRRIEINAVSEEGDYVPVNYVDPDGVTRMAVSAAHSWRRYAETTLQEHGGEVEEVFREFVLAQAATHHDADILILEPNALAAPRWSDWRAKAHVADARAGCAMLGLYLRAHNDFTVKVAEVTNFLPQDSYYRGAAIAALPAYDRWLHAAFTAWRDGGEPEPLRLLRGAEVRLGRALRARDYFNVRVRDFRSDDSWDEALFFFESFLLLLGGALDSAARFVHVVYDVPGPLWRVGWRRENWTAALVKKEPVFASLVTPSGAVRAIADLVGVLRNYIHGEALSHEIHLNEDAGPEIIGYGPGALAVGPEDGSRLIAAAELLGPRDEWGLEVTFNEVVLVLPGRFLAPLVRAVFAALRTIMDAVDLDRLTTERAEPFEPAWLSPGYEFRPELLLLTGLDGGFSAPTKATGSPTHV
jgi:hypothetical protein